MNNFGTSIDEAYQMDDQINPDDIYSQYTTQSPPYTQPPILPDLYADQGKETPTQAQTYVDSTANAKALQEKRQTEYVQKKWEEAQALAQAQAQHGKQKQNQKKDKVETFSEHPKKKYGDMTKSILFSLLIIFAIATHFFIAFLYEHFVTAPGSFSLRQEIGLRLLYPVIVLVIIWWAKCF